MFSQTEHVGQICCQVRVTQWQQQLSSGRGSSDGVCIIWAVVVAAVFIRK